MIGRKRIKVPKKKRKRKLPKLPNLLSMLRSIGWFRLAHVIFMMSIVGIFLFFVYSAVASMDEKRMEKLKKELFPKIKVEIYNASDYDGLARKLTWYMRDNNFDVIYYGNSKQKLEKTVIVDRVDENMRYAKVVREFLGGGYLKYEPDVDRLTTITIFIGKDFMKIAPYIAHYRKVF